MRFASKIIYSTMLQLLNRTEVFITNYKACIHKLRSMYTKSQLLSSQRPTKCDLHESIYTQGLAF